MSAEYAEAQNLESTVHANNELCRLATGYNCKNSGLSSAYE